jgi:hypothetical protein
VILTFTDLDVMGLRNIFVPFAQDVEAFAAQAGRPQAVDVRRLGVSPDQVLDHLPANLRQEGPDQPWWPTDRNGDRWELPTSEALLDVLPGILGEALQALLPDDEQRSHMLDREAELRRETGARPYVAGRTDHLDPVTAQPLHRPRFCRWSSHGDCHSPPFSPREPPDRLPTSEQ